MVNIISQDSETMEILYNQARYGSVDDQISMFV